jgi:hypothetical protein
MVLSQNNGSMKLKRRQKGFCIVAFVLNLYVYKCWRLFPNVKCKKHHFDKISDTGLEIIGVTMEKRKDQIDIATHNIESVAKAKQTLQSTLQ